jgi:integrase
MIEYRDLAALVVPRAGSLEPTGDPWEPWRLCDPAGAVVAPVAAYLRDLQASGRPETTLRTYSIALLRWFRFLWAAGVAWDQATRAEARDFCRWIQLTAKPGATLQGQGGARAGARNLVTGKAVPGRWYAPATAAHGESVLRGFYDFHREAGTGPMVNPFPLGRGRAGGHRNPMEPARNMRAGRYRPRLVQRSPRCLPDDRFNAVFAGLGSHRDRALVAFWVSAGARASELLGARVGDVDAGQQLITVIRKGTRALQQLPASPDAFVWLRLYQAQLHGLVPAGRDDPLWWTLRRPFRQLAYHAAYRMFTRVNATLGTNWGIHDLRHTAAYRMARDPGVPLTDVQWILGHARLATTQLYVSAPAEEAIASILAHYSRRMAKPGSPAPAAGYRAESLDVLFGADVQ